MDSECSEPNSECSERLVCIDVKMKTAADIRLELARGSREEAGRLVKMVVQRGCHETIKSCIARAATKLGWTFSRTQDVWRMEARRIDAFEMDQLRKIVGKAGAQSDSEGAGYRL